MTEVLNNLIAVFSLGYANLMPSINWLMGTLLGIELILLGFWWVLGGNEQVEKHLVITRLYSIYPGY